MTGKKGGEYSARRSFGASHSVVAKHSGGTVIAKVGSKLAGDDRETLKNEPRRIAGGESNRQREALAKQFDRVQRTVSGSVIDPAVVSVLLDDFAGFLVERAPRRSTMTEDERAWLIESGAMTAEELDEAETAIAGGALSRMELRSSITPIATALSTKEVADRLKIDETRVRHRLAKDGLYSIKVDGRHRFPEWQFVGDGTVLLPGLKQVIQALPDDLDPASVEGLMTSEQDNLLLQDSPVTPREWLQAGGSVDDVIDVIEGIDQ
ncbi:hypothetical protein [Microbacterium arborescens]